jgi:hypothetical protein
MRGAYFSPQPFFYACTILAFLLWLSSLAIFSGYLLWLSSLAIFSGYLLLAHSASWGGGDARTCWWFSTCSSGVSCRLSSFMVASKKSWRCDLIISLTSHAESRLLSHFGRRLMCRALVNLQYSHPGRCLPVLSDSSVALTPPIITVQLRSGCSQGGAPLPLALCSLEDRPCDRLARSCCMQANQTYVWLAGMVGSWPRR